jgi:hypothetical protein
MGRMVIVLVLSFARSIAILSNAMSSRNSEGAGSNIGYFDRIRLKVLTNSATEIFLRKMVSSPSTYAQVGHFTLPSSGNASDWGLGGTADVDVSSTSTPGRYVVMSRGHIARSAGGTMNDTTSVTVSVASGSGGGPLLNVTAAFGVSQNTTATFTIPAASTVIDGRNFYAYGVNMGNLDNTAPNLDAVSSGTTIPTFTNWTGNFTLNGKRVVGSGNTARDTVGFGAAQPDYMPLANALIPLATQIITSNVSSPITIGTHSAPQITYVHSTGSNVGMSQAVTGEGILILDPQSGNISITNGLAFKGLVLVVGRSGGQVNLTNGPNTYGAFILTGPNIKYNNPGGGPFRYSKEALDYAFTSLGLSGLPGLLNLSSPSSGPTLSVVAGTWMDY